jgi:hypothetical protein
LDYSGFRLRASCACPLTLMSDKLQFVECWRKEPMAEADDKLKFVGHFPQHSLNCKPLEAA